jgi:hypothetical protein
MRLICFPLAYLSTGCRVDHRPVGNPKERKCLLSLFVHTDYKPSLTLECLYTLHDRDIKASVIAVDVHDNINIFRYLQGCQRLKKHLRSQSPVLPGALHLDCPR